MLTFGQKLTFEDSGWQERVLQGGWGAGTMLKQMARTLLFEFPAKLV